MRRASTHTIMPLTDTRANDLNRPEVFELCWQLRVGAHRERWGIVETALTNSHLEPVSFTPNQKATRKLLMSDVPRPLGSKWDNSFAKKVGSNRHGNWDHMVVYRCCLAIAILISFVITITMAISFTKHNYCCQ